MGPLRLQEYLISDMVELLKTMLQYQSPDLQRTLETAQLEEIVLFIIAFMPASSYINNIYLRAQLGEVRDVIAAPLSGPCNL